MGEKLAISSKGRFIPMVETVFSILKEIGIFQFPPLFWTEPILCNNLGRNVT